MAIKSFRHKGLADFWQTGSKKGIRPELAKRIGRCLNVLNAATTLDDVRAVASFSLHALRGAMEGRWSITVNGPWRITFEWSDGAGAVDLEQYH